MPVDLKTIARREAVAFGGQPRVVRHWDDAEVRWVDVLSCADRPVAGVTSWATIGASRFDNPVSGTAGPVRVELVGACGSRWPTYANMLASVALDVESGGAVARPGIITPGVVALYEPHVSTQHLLLTDPFLWEEGAFASVPGDDYVVAWLMAVPVTDAELGHARVNSVAALERLFVGADIDVFDLDRPSVV